MAEDEDKIDSSRMEAFDLVTEALEKLDTYQQAIAADKTTQFGTVNDFTDLARASRPNHSSHQDLLISAEQLFSSASKEDPTYFKAKYFQAMVAYLNGTPAATSSPPSVETTSGDSESTDAVSQFIALQKSISEETDDAGSQFRDLKQSGKKTLVANELNYNLAAALFESGQWTKAITQFEDTIKHSQADSEVQLLARAGAALAYATSALKGSENRVEARVQVKKHRRFIRNELWPYFLPALIPLVRLLRRKKPIDKQVAYKVLEIIKRAERASESVSPSDDEESGNREKVHT